MTVEEKGDMLTIRGKVIKASAYEERVLFAANPIDRMMNYAGSGLPFPCPSIAFENSPSVFQIGESGEFQATFQKPNSYYTEDTQQKVKPSIFLKFTKPGEQPIFVRQELEDTLPLRTLFYRPERTGPEYYDRKASVLGVAGQETILRRMKDVKIRGGCA